MRAVQEQPVNSASQYKELIAKVDKLMGKINSTRFQHQEESGKSAPSKPKGTTKKESRAEVYYKDEYPIIYCHTYGISRNLTHGRMNW